MSSRDEPALVGLEHVQMAPFSMVKPGDKQDGAVVPGYDSASASFEDRRTVPWPVPGPAVGEDG
jgi:hypothetical protein